MPGEQRFIAAYYTQGIKVVDYFVDDRGRLQFEERASFTLPRANTWTAESFEVRRNDDGTRTYFMAVNDIERGIDVVSWTGRPNRMGAAPPPAPRDMTDASLLSGAVALIGGALLYRRRRLSDA